MSHMHLHKKKSVTKRAKKAERSAMADLLETKRQKVENHGNSFEELQSVLVETIKETVKAAVKKAMEDGFKEAVKEVVREASPKSFLTSKVPAHRCTQTFTPLPTSPPVTLQRPPATIPPLPPCCNMWYDSV